MLYEAYQAHCDLTGPLRAPVDVHRTRAALPDPAPVLRPRQPQRVAQHPQQRRLRFDIHLVPLAVHVQRKHDPLLLV